jgi:hypothetical protein
MDTFADDEPEPAPRWEIILALAMLTWLLGTIGLMKYLFG